MLKAASVMMVNYYRHTCMYYFYHTTYSRHIGSMLNVKLNFRTLKLSIIKDILSKHEFKSSFLAKPSHPYQPSPTLTLPTQE